MGTAIQGTPAGYTVTNLSQTLTVNEGDLIKTIGAINITPLGQNYADYFALVLPITGTSQAAAIQVACSNINGLSLTRTGDTYVITSRYIKNGTQVNNWQYFFIALRNLSITFTNSDISQSFTIPMSLYAGPNDVYTTNTLIGSGTLTVNVSGVLDVTGNIQSINVPMAMNGTSLTTAGGANVVISDPNQAAKTYRVTYTVNDVTNGSGTSDIYINSSATSQTWLKTFTVSGTQAYINSVIASSGVNNGLYFHNYKPGFYGTSTISYVQEVLTSTEPAAVVPYVQETGTLTLNTVYTAPFSIGANQNYTEDSSITFSLGSITDLAGDNWSYETCSTYSGFNCYTVTATVTGSFTGANPVKLTYSGDSSVDNTVTFTGTKAAVNALLASVQLIPPADYTDPLNISITVTRGNTPVTIYTGAITATCTSAHADFTTTGSQSFALGSNTWNVGSITDLATSKSYSVTLDFQTAITATMSSAGSGGTTSWNATGGAGGFGRLTITGTKTQVNSHLAAINFTTSGGTTLDSYVNILYTQTQTTNSVSQGTSGIFVGNTISWKPGNGVVSSVSAFVYDQDVAMTWDLASLGGQIDAVTSYTAKLVFSTPLSTANLGSVTGWTKETDYIWTKTGVKSTLNTALSAVVFNPPAQLVSNFSLDIKIYNGASLVADTSALGSTKTVYIRTLVSAAWTGSALSYPQDTATTFSNIATLNSNFNSGTYTLRIVTSTATGGTFTGWTAIDSVTFEKTDTKANLQTALNSLVFTPSLTFVSTFTISLQAYRSSLLIYNSATVPNIKTISIGQLYSIAFTSSAITYDQDTNTTWANFATLNSNFDAAKTYTIELSTSMVSAGTFTGWTQINSTTHSKTGTGAALQTALNSLVFVPTIDNVLTFTMNIQAYRSSTSIYNSASVPVSKTISIAGKLTISWGTATFNYNENTKKTFATFAVLNSVFDAAKTYTLRIISSTPLTTANGGTITGWTAIDSVTFEKTDTKANLQTALNSVELVPAADFRSTINFYITTYRSSVLANTNTTKSVPVSVTNTSKNNIGGTSVTLPKYASTTSTSIGTITDVRPDNISSAITYSLVIAPLYYPNYTLSTGGTGGTSVWDGKTLTLTGTKTQVNSHLATFTVGYSDVTTTTVSVTQTQTTNSVSQGTNSFTINRPVSDSMLTLYDSTAAYSTDNLDWTSTTTSTGSVSTDPSYLGSKWVVADVTGQSDRYLRANIYDGTTWTSTIVHAVADYAFTGNQNIARSQVFNGDHYIAVFVANKIRVFKSSDTTTWSLMYEFQDTTSGYGSYLFMNFSSSGGRLFVATSLDGPAVSGSELVKITMHSSSNGSSWSRYNLPGTSQDSINLTTNLEPIYNFNRSTWIMAIYYQRNDLQPVSQSKVYESADGVNWTNTATFNTSFPIGALATDGSNTFVIPVRAPSGGLHSNLVTTNGGTSWTTSGTWPSETEATQNSITNSIIVYAAGKFVARQGNHLLYSSNGSTWTLGLNTGAAVYDIKVINGAVYAANGTSIYKSTNGTSWTSIESSNRLRITAS